MKIKIIVLLTALVILSGEFYACVKAQTQVEMDEQAYQIYNKTNNELNSVYKQVLNKYKKDKVFISKLQKAELEWIKFRDAHLESIFPDEGHRMYGTNYPICKYTFLIKLTKQRIEQLKLWMDGVCIPCGSSLPEKCK